MKKFLLVAVAALAVVACKKDDNNGGEQPAPQETILSTLKLSLLKKELGFRLLLIL